MKLAIITLTKGGLEKGLQIANLLDTTVDVYGQSKFDGAGFFPYDGKVSKVFNDLFGTYDIILAIMATGIVIRSIKDLIGHKSTDPAILVMDEMGRNVISLLSGHLGGANYWANHIARKIDANPVITTASDVTGKLAVDQIAELLNLKITNFYDAMKVTSGIVNEEKVAIIDCLDHAFEDLCDIREKIKAVNISDSPKYVICLGNEDKEIYRLKFSLAEDVYISVLSEKKLVIGIGCRRDTASDHMERSVVKALDMVNRSIDDLKVIATVDVKKNEKAILDLAANYKIPLEIVSREEIKTVENRFELSEFVKKTIGVGAVCEPVAYLRAKKGKFLMNKTAFDGITISILEEENE